MPVQLVMPITAMMCQIDGRSTMAKSARIKTSVGTHITTSITRLRAMSIQPPK